MTFDAHELDTFLLVGSGVTLLAILAVRLSSRAGLPSLLIYLLMGVAARRAGSRHPVRGRRARPRARFRGAGGDPRRGWSDHQLARDPPLDAARRRARDDRGAVSVGIVAVAAHYLLGLPWQIAVLLGAVTSATDAAAVFSVLRLVPLPKRLTGALEAESGLNDAPVVVLVVLVSSGAAAEHGVLAMVGLDRLRAGRRHRDRAGRRFGGAWVMRRAALPSSGLYPIAVLCLTVLAYGAGAAVHALRVRRRLHRRAGPRQPGAPAPGGHPVVLRGRSPGSPRSGSS